MRPTGESTSPARWLLLTWVAPLGRLLPWGIAFPDLAATPPPEHHGLAATRSLVGEVTFFRRTSL